MGLNWNLIGHQAALEGLGKDIASGNLAHAYLFTGPESVGKYAAAKRMAEILQCENFGCKECQTCFQVERGSHGDTYEIDLMKELGESIKIRDMRRLIEKANLSGKSRFKIFLLPNITRFTREAANAFLKLLEEPPEKTIFLLTTSDLHLILPTIISRSRVVKFNNLSFGTLTNELQQKFPDKDLKEIEKATAFGNGKAGKSIKILRDPALFLDYQKVYQDILRLLESGSVNSRFAYIEELVAEKQRVKIFFELLSGLMRVRLLNCDFQENALDFAKKNPAYYLKTLSKIEKAGILLEKNINFRLVLENLMLNI